MSFFCFLSHSYLSSCSVLGYENSWIKAQCNLTWRVIWREAGNKTIFQFSLCRNFHRNSLLLPSLKPFPSPSLSLYFIIKILRFKILRTGEKISVNNPFPLTLSHTFDTKYRYVVLKGQSWFSWFQEWCNSHLEKFDEDSPNAPLSFDRTSGNFLLTVGPRLHFPY